MLNLDADAPLSDFGWEYLNKITVLRENGIQLCSRPCCPAVGYLYNTQNYRPMWMSMQDFCAAHDGAGILDFSLYRLQRDLNLKNERLTDAHLNGAGAEKFTAILCQTIQERAAGKVAKFSTPPTVEEKLTPTPDDSILWQKCNRNNTKRRPLCSLW